MLRCLPCGAGAGSLDAWCHSLRAPRAPPRIVSKLFFAGPVHCGMALNCAPPTGAPAAPALPTVVPAVAPGIEVRFRALVKLIKANPAYNTAMGQALGIEGPQQTPPDLTTFQPDIDVYMNGANVFVDWSWGGYANYLDMCEIQVDRGDGKGFVALAFDTTPGYTDTAPIPATPAKWTYRAIYRVNDAQVGLWSKLVSLIVGG